MYLIPAPASLREEKGSFLLSYETWMDVTASCSALVSRQAALFSEEIFKTLGYQPILRRGKGEEKDIVIIQDDSRKKESYELSISEAGVTLTGDEKGLWYGMQTLLQIIQQEGALLPALSIEDAPEIENRGYYFDCTRGRIPKMEWLKKLADRMAFYKLNQLQLYIEHTYLFRGMTELWRDDTPLTAAEIMELDYYCSERGIELVPSLSSFGHLHKLLGSKEYAHLSELEDSDKMPFSVHSRMAHHTINTADPEGIELIENMIAEFMELFTSRQFNICADETFDLGRGRSKAYTEEKGRDWVYIGYVKKLADFLLAHGRRPMFWGDIMWGFPEMIKELPEEIICLNWGYLWNQREDETRMMYEAGATQYCCPGCCGWNQYTTLNWYAYNNIMRQCTYAKKYGAIGVLNTDWGDYLHMNHPDFSRVGMIYGAAFSWNSTIPSYEDINRQISRIEYHDSSEKLLEVVAGIQENAGFEWNTVCIYREAKLGIKDVADRLEESMKRSEEQMEDMEAKKERLLAIERALYGQIRYMDSDRRQQVRHYVTGVEGMRLFNEVGKLVMEEARGMKFETMPDPWALAKQLEIWLYHYKESYRSVSRESELRRIEEVVCWYGDYLRERG